MADNEKIVSKQYPKLFHYTNVSAFENIYKTQQFWPTHYQDLNDTTEFARFRLKVREFIRPQIREIIDDSLVEKEAERLLDKIHSHTFSKYMYKDTFLSSFCAHKKPYEATHGLLSQWRGYGAKGGVAIMLDTFVIEESLKRDYGIFAYQIMYMADVIYDDRDNDVKIKEDFKAVFEYFPEIIKILSEQSNQTKLEPYFEKMHDDFVLGSTLVKHQAFHEENEVRIVVSPTTKDSHNSNDANKLLKEICYRQKDGREARYIKLFGGAPLPIERIIVGPSRIQNVNYQRISAIVDKNPCIEVVKSEIPFSS